MTAAAAVAGWQRNTGSDTEAMAGAVSIGGGRGGHDGQPDTDLDFDPAVGIWTHGLACLDQLGVLRRLEAEGRCEARRGEANYIDYCIIGVRNLAQLSPPPPTPPLSWFFTPRSPPPAASPEMGRKERRSVVDLFTY